MARKQATPDVELSEVEEMVDRGVTKFAASNIDAEFPDYAETEGAELEETPTLSAETAEPTSRRSRAAVPESTTPAVNLDDIPDFRAWKSKMDQQLAQERQRAAQMEQAFQAQQAQQVQAQLANLNAQLGEVEDPDERRAMIDQMAALQARDLMAQWQNWNQHVSQRVTAEGLDPSEFNPLVYQGQEGALKFELDVSAKKAAKLERELAAAKKAAAPETVAEIVQREVAKALQRQGYNQVDTGLGPVGPTDVESSWERDKRLLQQGKLPRGYLAKKYGSATP